MPFHAIESLEARVLPSDDSVELALILSLKGGLHLFARDIGVQAGAEAGFWLHFATTSSCCGQKLFLRKKWGVCEACGTSQAEGAAPLSFSIPRPADSETPLVPSELFYHCEPLERVLLLEEFLEEAIVIFRCAGLLAVPNVEPFSASALPHYRVLAKRARKRDNAKLRSFEASLWALAIEARQAQLINTVKLPPLAAKGENS